MAEYTIDKIEYGGNVYKLQDSVSGYGTGTITGVKTTAGAHTTIDVSSGNANFNVPTKTSHLTNDSGFITTYTDEKLKLTDAYNDTTYLPIIGTSDTAAATRQHTGEYRIYMTDTDIRLYLGSDYTYGNKSGSIYLYGTGTSWTKIAAPDSSINRVINLPNKGGTIALTTDIPTVPTITLNGSSTTSPSFYAPTGAGTSGQYLKSSGSGAPTWTNFPTIPSITLNGSSTTSPSFYAPTGAGTSGQYLKSNGSGAPSWTNFPTIPSITLNGSSTTSPSFYAPTSVGTSGNYLKSSGSGAPTWEAFPTIPSISLNGSSTTSPSFYAPTTAGTNGYYLTSNGSGAPSWTSFPTTISILQANVLDTNDTEVGSIAIDSNGAVEISNHNTQTKAVFDGGFSIVGSSGEIFGVDSSGNVNTIGSIYLPNARYLCGTTTGGNTRIVCGINSNDQYMFGYDGYYRSEGASYFDGNSVNIRSKGNITTNAPIVAITGGYKLLTIDAIDQDNVSISASSVNANIAISVTKTGYKPIGVVGYSFVNATTSGANYSSCVVTRVRVSGNNVNMTIKNNASSAAKIHIYLDVLYVNTTQGV